MSMKHSNGLLVGLSVVIVILIIAGAAFYYYAYNPLNVHRNLGASTGSLQGYYQQGAQQTSLTGMINTYSSNGVAFRYLTDSNGNRYALRGSVPSLINDGQQVTVIGFLSAPSTTPNFTGDLYLVAFQTAT